MARVKFYRGRQATYLADPTRFTDGLFFAKDKHLMYTGDGTAYGFDVENITAVKGIDLTGGILTIKYVDGKTPDKKVTLNDHIVLDGNSLKNTIAGLKADLSVVKLTTPTGDNYSASYQLQDSKGNVYGSTINVLKDQHISAVSITTVPETKNEETDEYIFPDHGSEALAITWVLANGTEETTYISLETFLQEAEAGDGIELVDHSYRIKLDSDNESEFLTLGPGGLKLSGVREAIESINKTDKWITYEELVELKEGEELISGLKYRITNYVTTTKESDYYRSLGKPFDIIVTALDEKTLDEDARCALHEGDDYFAQERIWAWKIKYCLENDESRFDWADSENGKGVIYGMEDEKGIKLGYDFHNIQFARWKVTNVSANSAFQHFNGGENRAMSIPAGTITSLIGKYVAWDKTITLPCTLTIDSSDFKWLWTFTYWTDYDMTGLYDASLRKNAIGLNKVTVRDVEIGHEGHKSIMRLGNNVFGQYIHADGAEIYDNYTCATDIKLACGENNTFGHAYCIHASHCFNRNILGHIYQCGIGEAFEDNIINTQDGGFWKNTIGAGFKCNIISDGLIYGNSFSPNFISNILYVLGPAKKIYNNQFGAGFSNNILNPLEEISKNTWESGYTDNLLSNETEIVGNCFGTANYSNTIVGNGFLLQNNVFESGLSECTLDLGGRAKNNKVLVGTHNINLSTSSDIENVVIGVNNKTTPFNICSNGSLISQLSINPVTVYNVGDDIFMSTDSNDGDINIVKLNTSNNNWETVPKGLSTNDINEIKSLFSNEQSN